jgi:plasmid stability protein
MTLILNISPQVEALLKERAATSGKEITQYASEILEQAIATPQNESTQSVNLSVEEWRARFKAFLAEAHEYAKQLPPDFVLDDSRESIYAGRGE